ncbi:MAG: type II toxin-antitoxin system RelE family toxin [Actinomycetota bacterium]
MGAGHRPSFCLSPTTSPTLAVSERSWLLEAQPEELGKELRGRLRGLWSCRVGNYGILYTIEGADPGSRVIVRAIRHRAVAYGRGRRR